MKAVGQSEMTKPILRVGSSFHIGDFTAHPLGAILHIPLNRNAVCGLRSVGQSGGPVRQTKGKISLLKP